MIQVHRRRHDLRTLELTYERLRDERDRLREARGLFARGLGPAPASAGISLAVVSAFGGGKNPGLLVLAGVFLGALVVTGIWYDGKPAYRHLYADEIGKLRKRIQRDQAFADSVLREKANRPEDLLPAADWYRAMICLERKIYGEERTKRQHHSPLAVLFADLRWPTAHVDDLQEAMDYERAGLRVVQLLWVLVIALLVAAALV